MAADTDLDAILEAARDLAKVTEAARKHAAARDFDRIAQAVERREHLIRILRLKGDLANLPAGPRAEVLEALDRTQKADQEIRSALESELASDSRAMSDAVNKSKVLSAYERLVPRPQRFDTQK